MTAKKNLVLYILVGSMAAFVLFVGQFVYRSMQYDLDLVTPNYYGEELKFGAKMDQRERSVEYEVNCIVKEGFLEVSFGDKQVTEGKIKLSRFDKTVADTEIKFGKGAKQSFNISRLEKGFWRISVEYTVKGETYIKEQNMNF